MKFIAYFLFVCFTLAALPLQATERTINVDGIGKASGKPDRAEIRLSVIANKPNAVEAIATVSEKARRVLKALSFYGVADSDIQTGSVSLSPVYQRGPEANNQQPKVIGYRAAIANTARVRKMEWLGKIIDNLSEAGADRLDGIRFYIDDKESLKAEARQIAVENAMAKARQLSDAAGVGLGEIVSITDSIAGPQPQPRMMAFAAAEGGTPVMPGEVSVRVRVQMIYAIK